MSFRRELTEYIRDKYSENVDEHESLFERRLIDSMGLLDIIAFIEERTGVPIPDAEVTPENFESVAVIDGLVERLRSAAS